MGGTAAKCAGEPCAIVCCQEVEPGSSCGEVLAVSHPYHRDNGYGDDSGSETDSPASGSIATEENYSGEARSNFPMGQVLAQDARAAGHHCESRPATAPAAESRAGSGGDGQQHRRGPRPVEVEVVANQQRRPQPHPTGGARPHVDRQRSLQECPQRAPVQRQASYMEPQAHQLRHNPSPRLQQHNPSPRPSPPVSPGVQHRAVSVSPGTQHRAVSPGRGPGIRPPVSPQLSARMPRQVSAAGHVRVSRQTSPQYMERVPEHSQQMHHQRSHQRKQQRQQPQQQEQQWHTDLISDLYRQLQGLQQQFSLLEASQQQQLSRQPSAVSTLESDEDEPLEERVPHLHLADRGKQEPRRGKLPGTQPWQTPQARPRSGRGSSGGGTGDSQQRGGGGRGQDLVLGSPFAHTSPTLSQVSTSPPIPLDESPLNSARLMETPEGIKQAAHFVGRQRSSEGAAATRSRMSWP